MSMRFGGRIGEIFLRNYTTGVTRLMSSTAKPANEDYKFETVSVTVPKEFVYHVELNRPEKRNSMSFLLWEEFRNCFHQIAKDSNCRAVYVSGAGKMFCAGIDLNDFSSVNSKIESEDVARRCKVLWNLITDFQETFSSMEKCLKPVVIAVHGGCLGAALSLITAGDIRLCTSDAYFQLKEIDLGLAADVGALQRFPKVMGSASLVRELALTGRQMFSSEAKDCGLVSRVFDDKESMLLYALNLCEVIAAKSPVAVQGTKANLNYSQDHPVRESLEYQANWNMSMLQSEDLVKAVMAIMSKTPAKFSKY